MKRIMASIIFIALSFTAICQQPSSPGHTRDSYLHKSKNQKTAAYILLIGGAGLIGTGILIGTRNEVGFDNAATAGALIVTGGLAALGSIPLFISSSKNKRRAMQATAYWKIENLPERNIYRTKYVPSLSLRLSFAKHSR